jgi:hypothetical protein
MKAKHFLNKYGGGDTLGDNVANSLELRRW